MCCNHEVWLYLSISQSGNKPNQPSGNPKSKSTREISHVESTRSILPCPPSLAGFMPQPRTWRGNPHMGADSLTRYVINLGQRNMVDPPNIRIRKVGWEIYGQRTKDFWTFLLSSLLWQYDEKQRRALKWIIVEMRSIDTCGIIVLPNKLFTCSS